MSIEAELRAELDRLEHRETAIIAVLPYVLLAVSTVVALMQPLWGGQQMPVPVVLGLTLLTAALMTWHHSLRITPQRKRMATGLYYTALMVLAAGLTLLAPWYGIFSFIGYIHAFLFLRGRWRYVGVVATSMISAVSYVGGAGEIVGAQFWEWIALALITSLLATSFFHFADVSDQRDHQQKRALTELHEANIRLEAALEENAGLHARLLVQAREAGMLDERQRMAREIHDTLAQSLAGILTQLQAAEQTMGEPPTVRRHLTNATNLAREGLREARRTVHAVGPELLAEARLVDAIGDVARRWSQNHHIDAILTTTGDPRPMHADVEVTLLRAAQEALVNVAKHAKAERVGLTLSYMEDLVTLDVRDDGIGFDPDDQRAAISTNGGFGLAGMRQRVQRLAGRLDIESEPGGGTAISASVPAIPAGSGG
ncbi:sensor histidine kinase [Actinoalloteichus hymeniacidonis]|uniref:Oxygen sensor histidine kinase NreB n=1 Tax=Actinoalloteichus hymeniacidonis TaxID=340345 RepID=A0AAC9MZZ2_9PSEU|nr:sensor histidine kinase [Actinoalloteichus hymeniacidonis]AOS65024.1 signal transduction histidine kinase [Actinoalloteichus hymeniacidonis]MBB5906897.1 signal transduction histidine kinase [Actinoalloteichus hymeniacidonis]